MIKKFAIIIESHNVAGQKIIPGAKKDAEQWHTYLRSDLGGAWAESEIVVMNKPPLGDVQSLLAAHSGDYLFVAFSGHGYEQVSYYGNTVKACLNDNEQDVAIDLIRPKYFGTAVFDCCRGLEYAERIAICNEAVAMDSFSATCREQEMNKQAAIRRVLCRAAFDVDLQKRQGQVSVRMLSCASNESAGENPSAGGYYTTLLMAGARKWERGFVGRGIYSTFDAHLFACAKMAQLNSRQHPQYVPSNQIYPFAVSV